MIKSIVAASKVTEPVTFNFPAAFTANNFSKAFALFLCHVLLVTNPWLVASVPPMKSILINLARSAFPLIASIVFFDSSSIVLFLYLPNSYFLNAFNICSGVLSIVSAMCPIMMASS